MMVPSNQAYVEYVFEKTIKSETEITVVAVIFVIFNITINLES